MGGTIRPMRRTVAVLVGVLFALGAGIMMGHHAFHWSALDSYDSAVRRGDTGMQVRAPELLRELEAAGWFAIAATVGALMHAYTMFASVMQGTGRAAESGRMSGPQSAAGASKAAPDLQSPPATDPAAASRRPAAAERSCNPFPFRPPGGEVPSEPAAGAEPEARVHGGGRAVWLAAPRPGRDPDGAAGANEGSVPTVKQPRTDQEGLFLYRVTRELQEDLDREANEAMLLTALLGAGNIFDRLCTSLNIMPVVVTPAGRLAAVATLWNNSITIVAGYGLTATLIFPAWANALRRFSVAAAVYVYGGTLLVSLWPQSPVVLYTAPTTALMCALFGAFFARAIVQLRRDTRRALAEEPRLARSPCSLVPNMGLLRALNRAERGDPSARVWERLDHVSLVGRVRGQVVALACLVVLMAVDASVVVVWTKSRVDAPDTLGLANALSGANMLMRGIIIPSVVAYIMLLGRQRVLSCVHRVARQREETVRASHTRALFRYVFREVHMPLNSVAAGVRALRSSSSGEFLATPSIHTRSQGSRSFTPPEASSFSSSSSHSVFTGYPAVGPGDQSMRVLAAMELASSSLAHLLDDVMHLDRIQEGRFTLDVTPFRPAAVLFHVMQAVRADADGCGVHLLIRHVPQHAVSALEAGSGAVEVPDDADDEGEELDEESRCALSAPAATPTVAAQCYLSPPGAEPEPKSVHPARQRPASQGIPTAAAAMDGVGKAGAGAGDGVSRASPPVGADAPQRMYSQSTGSTQSSESVGFLRSGAGNTPSDNVAWPVLRPLPGAANDAPGMQEQGEISPPSPAGADAEGGAAKGEASVGSEPPAPGLPLWAASMARNVRWECAEGRTGAQGGPQDAVAQATCVGDPHRLGQAMANLVLNAVQHSTANGRVWIGMGLAREVPAEPVDGIVTAIEAPASPVRERRSRLHRRRQRHPHAGARRKSRSAASGGERYWLRFVVRDEGRGMSRRELARVFRVFARMRAGEGVGHGPRSGGLGLAISRSICSMHGGAMGASSAGRGRGSTFWFEVPLTTVLPEPEPYRGARAASSAAMERGAVDTSLSKPAAFRLRAPRRKT